MSCPLPADDLELISTLSASFLADYRDATLLLTGGTGFIGRWILEAVQHANDTRQSRIKVLVPTRDAARARARLPHIFGRSDVDLLQGDIRSFRLEYGNVDCCLHGAAAYSDPHKATAPLDVFESIVEGTKRTLETAEVRGTRRYLFMSSGAVYGKQPDDVKALREDYHGAPPPLSPDAAYGNAKRTAEWLVAATAARSTPTQATIARIFSVIGPGMPLDRHFAAGSFIGDAVAGRPIYIRDGRPARTYIYAADLCIWLLRILASGTSGQAYNVGSQEALSVAAFADRVAAQGGVMLKADEPCGPTPARYVPDTTKARLELGLEEYTDIDAAIRKSLDWSRLASRDE